MGAKNLQQSKKEEKKNENGNKRKSNFLTAKAEDSLLFGSLAVQLTDSSSYFQEGKKERDNHNPGVIDLRCCEEEGAGDVRDCELSLTPSVSLMP